MWPAFSRLRFRGIATFLYIQMLTTQGNQGAQNAKGSEPAGHPACRVATLSPFSQWCILVRLPLRLPSFAMSHSCRLGYFFTDAAVVHSPCAHRSLAPADAAHDHD